MKAIFVGIIVLLIPWMVTAQGNTTQLSDGVAYSNTVLRFRYQPPSEMQNVTKGAEAEIRAHAEALHSNNSLGILLAMTSGSDEAVPGWHALAVETYPRKAFSDLDDAAAEAKMSAWVMGFADARPLPKSVVVSGQTFAVSVFEEQKGPIKKGAVVWTTIRRGELLSFAFAANSSEQLKAVAESIRSLRFF
jgi:hypothetical protein